MCFLKVTRRKCIILFLVNYRQSTNYSYTLVKKISTNKSGASNQILRAPQPHQNPNFSPPKLLTQLPVLLTKLRLSMIQTTRQSTRSTKFNDWINFEKLTILNFGNILCWHVLLGQRMPSEVNKKYYCRIFASNESLASMTESVHSYFSWQDSILPTQAKSKIGRRTDR